MLKSRNWNMQFLSARLEGWGGPILRDASQQALRCSSV